MENLDSMICKSTIEICHRISNLAMNIQNERKTDWLKTLEEFLSNLEEYEKLGN